MSVEIKEIIINVSLPTEKLGIVMLQPYIELNNDVPPYKWKTNNNEKQNQLNAIERTLSISKSKPHGFNKTHFTLFPEYSIPGLEGMQIIDNNVSHDDWENGTIIIGGIDGLSNQDYSTLCAQHNVFVDDSNKPDKLGPEDWVNCIVSWIKEENGAIKKYIQPKCSKAFLEDHLPSTNMFQGNTVDLYKCHRGNFTFCFLSLICFDWIHSDLGSTKRFFWDILEKVQVKFGETRTELDLVFVLQHNPKPNDRNFLENARDFFEESNVCEGVIRDKTILGFINSAGGTTPGRYPSHGCSSFIYSRLSPYNLGKCEQTFATQTSKLRKSNVLKDCKDTCFRENGSCIYSVGLILPQTLPSNVGGGRIQHLRVQVHQNDVALSDCRTPNGEVPASIKWLNDVLDNHAQNNYNSICNNEAFANLINSNHNSLIDKIRQFNDKKSKEFIEFSIFDLLIWNINKKHSLKPAFQDRIMDNNHVVDNWDTEEENALKELLYLLSILSICFTVDILKSLYHGSISCRDISFNIIYVSHVISSKEAFDKLKKLAFGSSNSITLLVLKSEDLDYGICNTIYPELDISKLPSIYNTDENIIPVSIIDIWKAFRISNDIGNLRTNLLNLIKYGC